MRFSQRSEGLSPRYDSARPDCLAPFTFTTTKAGAVKAIKEYVNPSTGEIVPASVASVLNLGAKIEARGTIMRGLRPEVRGFAEFVLKFANRRRGITPGIDQLCQWYADLQGKRVDNVRRYIPALKKARVLAHESLLGPDFQRTGGTARDHLSEEPEADDVYREIRRRSLANSEELAVRKSPMAVSTDAFGKRRGTSDEIAIEAARLERVQALIEARWAVLYVAWKCKKTGNFLTSTGLEPAWMLESACFSEY